MNNEHKPDLGNTTIKVPKSSFTVGGIIKESWGKVKGCKGTILLSFLVVMLVSMVINVLQLGVDNILINMGYSQVVPKEMHFSSESRYSYKGAVKDQSNQMQTNAKVSRTGDKELILSKMGMLLSFLARLIFMIILLPLSVGLLMLGIKRATNQPLTVGSLFHYYSRAVSLWVAYILCFVLITIGFFCFVLPGIYLMVALMFVQPLIVDKNMGPWAAIKTSIKIASMRWFRLFGLGFLIMLFNFIGILLIGIGLIWTLPLGFIAYGVAYQKLFGVEIKDKAKKNSQLLA